MGGHGGLNILPQKSWNVYNFDNREKVRKDEEAAARDEQQKLEQSRRQDLELRIQKLRQVRNLSDPTTTTAPAAAAAPSSSNPSHINLFENFADFEYNNNNDDKSKSLKVKEKEDKRSDGGKKRKREEGPSKVVITAEDEKYRLGYGLAGKGVKAPWYLSRPEGFEKEEGKGSARGGGNGVGERKRSGGKKSIEELREERMRRERKEKERERALLSSKNKGADKGFSRRRM